jgi:hypothetical protein
MVAMFGVNVDAVMATIFFLEEIDDGSDARCPGGQLKGRLLTGFCISILDA